ncbi:glycosyltransferase family 2 protein [Methylomonas koyamae]|uniref:glycosyltransferase family 2 protein n=1 Tax=Methylomonas koyamae TaxID=702114 RepID=UPI002873D4B0|nr:glycosyltransferase family 2 protein [Methylomonas koyamae]WNB74223.1 glycosyltransferase family 2 protein [Methylomonas koyamae]
MNKLYIVITDFNGFTQTRRCLDALSASTYKDFTVLVVDHGTTEETRIGLAQNYPDVIRLTGTPELWWAGANNLGIRFAMDKGADLIMLLNNDCYVEPDTLNRVISSIASHREAIIAPVQLDWRTGRFIAVNPKSCFLFGFPTVSGKRKPKSCMEAPELLSVKLIIGGRGAVIPVSIIQKVGFFDEKRLPHYGADHDFYIRATKLGVKLGINTSAFVKVDNAKTTIASNLEVLAINEFIFSLISVRSHRNIRTINMLFRLHFPIRRLYYVGVMLYYLRYFLVYMAKRFLYLVKNSM